MKKKKTFMGMAIIIAILVLGVGYAAVEGVDLFVTGTANIKANAVFPIAGRAAKIIKSDFCNPEVISSKS